MLTPDFRRLARLQRWVVDDQAVLYRASFVAGSNLAHVERIGPGQATWEPVGMREFWNDGTRDAVKVAHEALLYELDQYGLGRDGPLIDKIAKLPKKVIYRLSYEGLKAEAPSSGEAFRDVLEGSEPTTAAGRQLVTCLRDLDGELATAVPLRGREAIRAPVHGPRRSEHRLHPARAVHQ